MFHAQYIKKLKLKKSHDPKLRINPSINQSTNSQNPHGAGGGGAPLEEEEEEEEEGISLAGFLEGRVVVNLGKVSRFIGGL